MHVLVTEERLLFPPSDIRSTAAKIIIFNWNSVFAMLINIYVSNIIVNHDFKRFLLPKKKKLHFGLILPFVFTVINKK